MVIPWPPSESPLRRTYSHIFSGFPSCSSLFLAPVLRQNPPCLFLDPGLRLFLAFPGPWQKNTLTYGRIFPAKAPWCRARCSLEFLGHFLIFLEEYFCYFRPPWLFWGRLFWLFWCYFWLLCIIFSGVDYFGYFELFWCPLALLGGPGWC